MDNPVRGRFRGFLAIPLSGMHVAAVVGVILYPPWHVGWPVLVAAYLLYRIRSLGISLMHHRYWTHGAFKCGYWTQVFWAFCASLAFEGPAMIPKDRQSEHHSRGWVADHHQHHRYADGMWDPHSPKFFGFWWAHFGWLDFDTLSPPGYHPIDVLQNDPVARWQYRWCFPLAIGVGFSLPTLIWGLPGLVWCGFVSVVFHLNCAWMVNSVCHLWGRRPRARNGGQYSADNSRNNRFVAFFTEGEGNHGNHHVWQNSAQYGKHWYDFDTAWLVIRYMQRLGLAWDVNKLHA